CFDNTNQLVTNKQCFTITAFAAFLNVPFACISPRRKLLFWVFLAHVFVFGGNSRLATSTGLPSTMLKPICQPRGQASKNASTSPCQNSGPALVRSPKGGSQR